MHCLEPIYGIRIERASKCTSFRNNRGQRVGRQTHLVRIVVCFNQEEVTRDAPCFDTCWEHFEVLAMRMCYMRFRKWC